MTNAPFNWLGIRRDANQRFMAFVHEDQKTGCWLWTGALNSSGYAVFSYGGKGKVVLAHRWIYKLAFGPLPSSSHVLDHIKCDTPRCVNPNHLTPVLPRENNARSQSITARNARKTRCPKGHEYTSENTYERDRTRQCRACQRIHKRRWARNHAAQRNAARARARGMK
jgi:hypothetical protein